MFDDVTTNIIAYKPTLFGIVNGIKNGINRLSDIKSRLEGAKLNWPKTWDDDRCYGNKLFLQIKK